MKEDRKYKLPEVGVYWAYLWDSQEYSANKYWMGWMRSEVRDQILWSLIDHGKDLDFNLGNKKDTLEVLDIDVIRCYFPVNRITMAKLWRINEHYISESACNDVIGIIYMNDSNGLN